MSNAVSNTISYQLAQLCRAQRGVVGELLSQCDLRVGQEMLLLQLWDQDGQTQSALAEQLCVQPATVTVVLRRMEKAGLIQRRKDAQDQRVSRVFLTENGRNLQETVCNVWQTLERHMTADVTAEERQQLLQLLAKIQQNLQTKPD